MDTRNRLLALADAVMLWGKADAVVRDKGWDALLDDGRVAHEVWDARRDAMLALAQEVMGCPDKAQGSNKGDEMIDYNILNVSKEEERKALPFEVSNLINSIICIADSYSALCKNCEDAPFNTITTLAKTLRLTLMQVELGVLE